LDSRFGRRQGAGQRQRGSHGELWDAISGERKDTLAQSLKEVYTVAFSPMASGCLRAGLTIAFECGKSSDAAAETTNPILESNSPTKARF